MDHHVRDIEDTEHIHPVLSVPEEYMAEKLT